jgi:hypothetical protein
MFDDFAIGSGTALLLCSAGGENWSVEAREATAGTFVTMRISPESPRTMQEVFERFASVEGGLDFDRTRVVVRLVDLEGRTLVSRSQAKHIVAGIERFREVILDFEGVESVTPAFADEIFRVFASGHQQAQLLPCQDNAQVRAMIQRAAGRRKEQAQRGE